MDSVQRTPSKRPVLVLDGGTGIFLNQLGVPIDPKVWSARALLEPRFHKAVVEAHRRFIEAGADVIITNNYAAIPHYLEREGCADQYESLTHLAGKLAAEARNGAPRKVLVAGSLPPLDASYSASSVNSSVEAMTSVYERIARALEPNVDVFLCETLTTPAEAIAALTALKTFQKEVWISFTVSEGEDSGKLRGGKSISEALSEIGSSLLQESHVSTVMFNCSTPDAILAALRDANASQSIPDSFALGCYPNGTEPISNKFLLHRDAPLQHNPDLANSRLQKFVKDCFEMGATVVGGCCRIYPEQIKLMRETLDELTHSAGKV